MLFVTLITVLLSGFSTIVSVLTQDGGQWVDVWTAMPQLTEYDNLPSGVYNSTPKFNNTTIRQTLKLDIPTSAVAADTNYELKIRLRISNAFGTTPLTITNATIARPSNNVAGISSILPETLQILTFDQGESSGVTIPAASLAVSDSIPLSFPPQYLTYTSTNGTTQSGSIITITLYLANGQDGDENTSHPGSRTTSFLSLGNQVTSTNLSSDSTSQTQSLAHWYFIATVEAVIPSSSSATSTLIIIGDSITDGRGSTTDQNNRWPDQLFTRLQQNQTTSPSLSRLTISNQAAGGNRILADGLGPSALSRFDRDALSHSSISSILIFSGVNDIGTASPDTTTQSDLTQTLISAYRQLILRAHAQNIPILGATITPFGNLNTTLQPYSDPVRESTRQQINDFIRSRDSGFDAVADFDAVVSDPQNRTMLDPRFDSGDGLHPNPEGYRVMALEFPLDGLSFVVAKSFDVI